MILTELAL